MDPTSIDPQVVELGVRVGEAAARNTAAAIAAQIRAVKARRNDRDTIATLEEIVRDLISDKNDLVQSAQALQARLTAQQIADEDITFITDTVIPVLKDMVNQNPGNTDPEVTRRMEEAIEIFTPLLSPESLKVLQLIGFNFRQAIGGPLTQLIQKLITSRFPADQAAVIEQNRLNLEISDKLVGIARDPEGAERLRQVMAIWRGPVVNS